ncbi:flagellar biosynthetic protein FliR [Syntrophorhabdus aromaticivorans]|uniref:Flagellar biosynthetic protein FliR n=1 Tax=Syntrophorhabdus aromaticivorans TaxID=328301 RepID=A0A351U0J7_9BACT|nr:flagellar biosynthetic protein FliR [Syntrophorhabdus aromaticivorans]NLW36337.1 flagellar biosynthetic protein FliR [Syntrophorhabdus aromaticivorans]HBA53478.1 flagellar biosynthetic protein FliR [Syntrophorhabdus aromaticivorans]
MDIGADGQRFVLIFSRVAAILWFLPLFSSRAVSVPFKAGLSLLISFLFLDSVGSSLVPGNDPYQLLLLIVKEVFIGLVISFFVRLLFAGVDVAGKIISLQSSFAFAQFMDPLTMTQVTVIERFKNLMAMMLFLAIDAHHVIIRAMYTSFRDVPIGAVAVQSSLLQYLINATGKIFGAGLRIGAPVIVTLLLVELALGMLSRMIPQVNIFIEGVPIKILLAMTMLSLSLGVVVPGIVGIFRGLDGEILKIFRLMV